MSLKASVNQLMRASGVVSIAIMVFFIIMTYLQDLDIVSNLLRSIFAGLVFFVTSMLSIVLIIAFEKDNLDNWLKNTKVRFILGVLINMMLMIIYRHIREIIGSDRVSAEHFDQFKHIEDLGIWQLYLLTFISSLMMFGLVHLLHNSILLNNQRTRAELEVSKLRASNVETANQLLRQQVQPHFLFNALSVLKTLISSNPKIAEKYLIHLSDFLRVSFSQDKKDVASVDEELKLCRDYLEMQKMRFGDALVYSFDVSKQYLHKKLPFFSLQMLVENAIKHNELTDKKPLRIKIFSNEDYIVVSNNLQRKKSVEGATGYGLPNLSERHKLLTGHNIEVINNGDDFIVALKII